MLDELNININFLDKANITLPYDNFVEMFLDAAKHSILLLFV